jgi:hypothetical protein
VAIAAEFSTLWKNLPQWSDARKIVPPNPPKFKSFPQIPGLHIPVAWETCCIQMSHAMNKCGLNIRYEDKKRVLTDTAGNEYMLDVKEMRGYLSKNYGSPDNVSRTDVNGKIIPRFALQASLADRHGIIAFGGRHIDLWDGRRIHGENYIESALWEAKSTISDGIFFWDVEDA